MSVNSYYRDELSYLKELGAEFAKANPRLSKYLADDPTDPDVERLMEGFAFLVGRLRQRLDAEMPGGGAFAAQADLAALPAACPADDDFEIPARAGCF
jgi:hypothetical protein